ncbi:hypothetical protein [Catalinimonas niigatensis]|uniref:hypothetical protein n=1 Tax=Catalinimonas niigatensis TaxID=1397264 RepID=UPI0026659CCD|nr:hypothetical protein [Catalinimonas niigatensis]WPP52387.1 hypothetical protein PZB72_08330 [Catalinimonas niigatensis]
MKYEKKVIAYIDLLGFKSFINFTDKSANSKETKIDYVNKLFLLLKELTENKNYSNTKLRQVTQFSDLIVISFAADDFESFFDEVRDIQLLCINCINRNFLVRGSIIYGDIVHSDNVIFGPGLIESYETEKSLAKHPRIIIDEVIIKDYKEVKPSIFDLDHIVSIDEDGLYYVDYFSKARYGLDQTNNDYEKHILNLAKIIYDISESPKLREKAIWLFNKFKVMLAYYPLFREEAQLYHLEDIKHVFLTLSE